MLETVTGKLVNIQNPDPATINIEDIAWGLSRMPRFCGHTITVVPYNVAQHCMFVADEVEVLMKEAIKAGYNEHYAPYSNDLILKALLHDAAEVYTGDLPSPMKRIPELRPIIKKIEAGLDAAIYASLDLAPMTEEDERIIKLADKIAQKIEANAFMPSRGKGWPDLPDVSLERLQQFSAPLDSLTSYKLFMERFNSLQLLR